MADLKQVDLLINGHYYIYFQHYYRVQKLLMMTDSKQVDLSKRTLTMNVRTTSFIVSILNPFDIEKHIHRRQHP